MPVADIYITYANAPNDTIINDLPGKKVLFLLGLSDEDDIAKPFDGVMTTSNWLVDAARAAGHETVGKIGVGLEMSFKPKLEPSPARNIGTLVREPSRKDSKLVSEALLLTQSEIILSTLNVITFSDCDVRGPSQHYTKPTRKMIPHIYQQCGIWLVGSEREGFGMPGLEAMACGCALITTDTRGSREYAIHEETALIVKDSAEMALAIGRLVSDDDLREKLSYNGIKKSEQFVWPKVLMRADAFLRAVL
jgi:glycosyltransferase involved in cell wall biosynthesis